METVAQIDPQDLDPLVREANRGLMVAFINADLIARYGLDVGRSVVLYNAEKRFVYATAEIPDSASLEALAARTGVRFWSHGC